MENSRFKFRAWDGEQMWYPETHTVDRSSTILKFYNPNKGIKWGLYDAIYDNRIASGEYHKLMQYTGLKDKNGIEIYEGDMVYWKHLGNSGIVYYNEEEAHFFVKPTNTDDKTESYLDSTHMEVTGNLYEKKA